MKFLLTLFAALMVGGAASAEQPKRPPVSEKPYAMMQKLAMLEGDWEMVTEMTQNDGETWQAMPPAKVSIELRHKDLMLAEVPQEASDAGFHMETYITYDRYREVYRKAAIDDVWGIMDLYEGKPVGDDTIVFENLKADTSFLIAPGVWRHFRLTLELRSPKRTLMIEKTDNGGESWEPAFRVTYTKL
ncbi:DUF1579 family protein [Kordiimonas lacus]|uniref:DUF1579 domain-containing protein n=1 Tax=Kordiimonas lacus TaxID=637679 RepID=A0A1G6SVK0_9PROT|nr:DUF1579 family protein [Kordiimonas lacus]SDD20798.1 Protein of unknown function [Kordiimonas lacus]